VLERFVVLAIWRLFFCLLCWQRQRPERFSLLDRDDRDLSRPEYHRVWRKHGWSWEPNHDVLLLTAGM